MATPSTKLSQLGQGLDGCRIEQRGRRVAALHTRR